MQKTNTGKLFSASDLVNFAACSHLTHLDLVNLETPLAKAADTEDMKLIQDKGFEHEGRYLQLLQSQHNRVLDLRQDDQSDASAFAQTQQALQSGAEVLFQATFLNVPWVGHADFLVRVDTPSRLGDFSYEVVDTKLARSSRAKFLLQLCLYSEMLAEVQGVMPRHTHVVLGNGCKDTFRIADYLRYYRQLKQRFLAWTARADHVSFPERCDKCSMCRWRDRCSAQWEDDDHLNRVSGITRVQMPRFSEAGISTMKALAKVSVETQIPRVQSDTKNRLAHQARLQVQSLETGKPVYEVLPLLPGKGFGRLQPPNAGDLFFDMEGDPLEEGGLEYLFGLYYFEEEQPVFKPFWGHSRTEEKSAFEAFMDFVTQHLARWPKAHIYHYAPYEPTALKRLMSLHGTRENEVDNLLRQGKLIDLYAVVREGLRVGEPSYSIKYLERFYGSPRTGDVTNAGASIVFYEQWKVTQDQALLQAIEDYNKDDVISTFELRQWLMRIRPQDAVFAGVATQTEEPPNEKVQAAEQAMAIYRQQLLDGLPEDRQTWTAEHRLNELMFHLLGFHRRAEKPAWWALFARQQASAEELLDDMDVIAGLEKVARPQQVKGNWQCSYSFPEQAFKLKTGDSCTVVHSLQDIKNLVIDEDGRRVSFVCSGDTPPPDVGLAIGSGTPIPTYVIQAAYKRFVDAYLAGASPFGAGLDLLRRAHPRVVGHPPGLPLLAPDKNLLEGTLRVVANLDNSYLFIQGPPGAGKTYTGSQVIVGLLKAGKTIAVTSNSHKAINNLLKAVEKVAVEKGVTFTGIKKSSGPESVFNGQFIADNANATKIAEHVSEFALVAGTAWLFSSVKLAQKFDYLFVDEAGQVSLANLLAMSTCAKNIVLLGDQMQLGQPVQGVHPEESGQSTLDYLLKGQATIAAEAGIFLNDTWRMHPDVCQFISDAVYDGRLKTEPQNANQRLVLAPDAHPALKPTGIQFLATDHDGCAQRCEIEAEVIREIFQSLLVQHFRDRQGAEHPMTVSNILVVAPYNQQVNWLKRVLPEGARVGTVDKFQGQEAEVVLVSMTTSSGQYLPRDIEFLYSKNRLNVAVSRARCLAVVVASPRLLDVDCKTPAQMALVNTLCWIRDYSCQ